MVRRFVSLVLCVALLPHMTACTKTTTQEIAYPAEVPAPEERVQSVTTVDGKVVDFDAPGAQIEGEAVVGSVSGEVVELPLQQVERLWVTRKGTDTLATIGVVVLVASVAVLTAGLIALATKESCPFIYSWDGTKYVFDAEPYGGAVTRGLERDDYAELENLTVDGEGLYRLKITNEVRETQYTNLLELWVIDHPRDMRVVADEWGRLHTLADPQAPLAASDAAGRDLLPWLAQNDRRIWEAPAILDEPEATRQDIVLTFPKPRDATTAKLVANVATGLWGSHMIREMLELRGRGVDEWYAQIDDNPAARDSLLDWNLREEVYLLKVYVEEPSGWEVRGILPGGGPFIAEDRVVPLDVSRAQGDSVRIRIQPPYGYWALNYFGLDYSVEQDVAVTILAPLSARDAAGDGVLSSLLAADDSYYTMPQLGDFGYITFAAPDRVPGLERTLLLHSRGYYRQHLSRQGDPQLAVIRELTTVPGAAVRLAAQRFAERQAPRAASQ